MDLPRTLIVVIIFSVLTINMGTKSNLRWLSLWLISMLWLELHEVTSVSRSLSLSVGDYTIITIVAIMCLVVSDNLFLMSRSQNFDSARECGL